jgi:hypothetical protein
MAAEIEGSTMKQLFAAVMLAFVFVGGGAVPAQETLRSQAAPPEDGGTVVFFRAKKFMGAAEGFKVREGAVEIGRLRNGTFFTIRAAVGKHEYATRGIGKDLLRLEVESGETYYIQGSVAVGGTNLSPSDRGTFEALKPDLRDVTGQGIEERK